MNLATTSSMAVIMQLLAAVQARVVVLQAMAEAALLQETTIGAAGVLPGTTVAALSSATSAVWQLEALAALAGTLGRIGINAGSVYQTSGTLVTAGGDLFHIAASSYGYAQAWTTIAAANGLADPLIQGIQTLTVPDAPDTNDGVLNA